MEPDNISFDFSCCLGTSTIPLKIFSHLEIGDILILDSNVEEDLDILIEGEKKFSGIPGLLTYFKAIKIKKQHE